MTRGARVRYLACARALQEGLASCARAGRPAAVPDCGRLLAVEFKRSAKEGDVRVTTAFNRMLGLPGAWVRDVEFSERAVIVTVALRRKRPICSGCAAGGLKMRDRVAAVGGTLEIDSRVGAGTWLRANTPIAASVVALQPDIDSLR